MTPAEKLKQKIIHMATGDIVVGSVEVNDLWEELDNNPDTSDERHDRERELRGSGLPTGLPTDYSRHYESKAVAAEMLDGSWVGWTYWYGGGKHGEPGGIPWIEDAYAVESFTVMEPVRKFRKVGQ